jgi:hypothetical protein
MILLGHIRLRLDGECLLAKVVGMPLQPDTDPSVLVYGKYSLTAC